MINKFGQSGFRREVVAALFLPLLVFTFFSAGTMPVFSKQGVEIIICSGTSPAPVTIQHDENPHGESIYPSCEFVMQMHAATLPDVPKPEFALAGNGFKHRSFEKFFRLGRLACSNSHARAPPVLL